MRTQRLVQALSVTTHYVMDLQMHGDAESIHSMP